MNIDGGCHCGRIRYRAEIDPDKVEICHCTDCQTLSGSAYRTVVVADADSFQLQSGTPKLYAKTADDGSTRLQAFCPDCGSPLYSVPPQGETGPKLVFQRVPEPQTATKNRLHIDIVVGDEIEAEVDRLVGLGASKRTELIEEVGTSWVVMADPEGNEFCFVT